MQPDNLGLTSDGQLKLFDFGLCRCIKRSKNINETYQMTGDELYSYDCRVVIAIVSFIFIIIIKGD